MLQAMRMTLPDNVFFKPTPAFLKRLVKDPQWRYLRFHDLGAGQGHLTRELQQRGLWCKALDINQRENPLVSVEMKDATSLTWYNRSAAALIARPDHSGWAATAAKYASMDLAPCLYIGKQHNLARDITDAGLAVEMFMQDVGEEGEHAWRVLGPADELVEWCLIKLDEWLTPQWRTIVGDRWENAQGGWFPVGNEKILERRSVFDPCQLTRDPYDMMDTGSRGWIEPDGTWHGVEYAYHNTYLQHVFGIQPDRAEEAGFIHCYGEMEIGLKWYKAANSGRPTPKQRRTLEAHGYTMDDHQEYLG